MGGSGSDTLEESPPGARTVTSTSNCTLADLTSVLLHSPDPQAEIFRPILVRMLVECIDSVARMLHSGDGLCDLCEPLKDGWISLQIHNWVSLLFHRSTGIVAGTKSVERNSS